MPLDQQILRKIGQRIREARNERKLSQERLAEMSNLSSTYIGRLERGEKQPSMETLIVLAESLKVSPLDLLIDLETKLGKRLIRSRIKKLVDLL
ncbi:helix-turn-helix domain-containing protein [Acidobacteria bacterium AH-259-L09]|nr:helix-turn-helix domain-containing protein [Acidobacteria bacterium AH-259-L09]